MDLLATICSILSIPYAAPMVFGPGAAPRFGSAIRERYDQELPRSPWRYRLACPIWIIAPTDEMIEEADLPIMGARFGRFGLRSICDRVWAEIEHATRQADYYTIALLPAAYFDESHDGARRKLLALTHSEVLRCWVDGALIGQEHPACLIVWRTTTSVLAPPVLWRVRKEADFERLKATVRTHAWQSYLSKLHDHIKEHAKTIKERRLEQVKGRSVFVTPAPADERQRLVSQLDEAPKIRASVQHGRSVILRPMNPAARALLQFTRSSGILPLVSGSVDGKVLDHVPIDPIILRASMLVRHPLLLERRLDSLRSKGAEIEESHDLRPWLERCIRRAQRLQQIPFEQTIRREDGKWETIHEAAGVRALHAARYRELHARAQDLPWKTWQFHHDDLARTIIKGSALYVADQGTGKTRFTLSSIALRRGRRSLVVLEARLIPEFLAEVKAVGFPREQVHIIEQPEDARPENLRQINLVAYSRLGRGVKLESPLEHSKKKPHERRALTGAGPSEARRRMERAVSDQKKKASDEPYKRTIAHLLRKVRFHTLYCDEGHRLANLDAQQTQGVMLIRAKHVIVMSGTPIKNYPDGALALWLRVAGERSPLCPYSDALPVLVHGSPRAISGRRLYNERFVSYKTVKSQHTEKRTRRKMPLIPEESLDLWRDQLAPLMCRRSMHEPEVAREIPLPPADIKHLEKEMDHYHVDFYQWWLDQFFEWMTHQIQLEAAGQKTTGAVSILTQLGKLDFATGFPQGEQLKMPGAPEWSGGLTSKQKLLLSTLETMAPRGYKSIVFALHPDFLELMAEELEERNIRSIVIHGEITADKRAKEIARYRTDDTLNVMLAAYKAANTGYNIPEADVVYCYDWPWVPSEMDQAEKRMIRPAWLTAERAAMGAQPMIRRMVQTGGLDEYKRQLVYLKAQGADQAINHQRAEFDPDNWLSYRDFAVKMLRDRGYKI